MFVEKKYSILAYNFGEFRLSPLLLTYGDVDGGGGFFTIEAATHDYKLVIDAVVSGAAPYGLRSAKWELIVGTGSIEDGFVGICYWLLSGIVWQLGNSTHFIDVLF